MGTPRAVALLLFVASLPAQEPPRDGIFGEVKDRDGKVFAGVTVTLLHVAHPALVDAKYVDRVTATTDEHGRFRAQLLHGMPYVAWANGPVADGAFACSQLATDVIAGVPVLLQATEQRSVRRVRPKVDAAWKDELQFVASARVGSYLLRESLAVVDGAATLPPFPTPVIALHALRGEFTVFTVELPATVGADGADHDVAIGPPVTHAVQLLDQRDNPVPGALLTPPRSASAHDERLVRFGRSDDNGIARVQFAGEEKLSWMVLATGPTITANAFECRAMIATDAGGPGVVKLRPGTAVKGRVLLRPGEPAAAMPLLLDSLAATTGPGSGLASGVHVQPTAADGTFAFHASQDAACIHWFAGVLTPDQRARFARSATEPPLAAVALLVPPTSATEHDLRVDALGVVDVKVRDAQGGAPGFVQIVVVPMGRLKEGDQLPMFPFRTSTDRAGRARFFAPKGADLAMWAFTKSAATWLRTTVDGRVKELRLDGRHVLPVRVVDGDGKALAGVEFYGTLTTSPHLSKEGEQVRRFVDGIRYDAPWYEWKSDKDGCADLIVPMLDCTFELQFAGEAEDLGWFRGTPAERMQLVVKKRR